MALIPLLRNISKINGNATSFLRAVRPISLVSTAPKLRISESLGYKLPVKSMTRSICVTAPRLSVPGGSHIGLWTAERVVSIALLGVIPAAFVMPSQFLDAAMAVSVVMHQYWGLEAICTDYLRPGVVGNLVSKMAHITLIILTAATLSGLFYFIYNDIGIAKSIKKIWSIKGE